MVDIQSAAAEIRRGKKKRRRRKKPQGKNIMAGHNNHDVYGAVITTIAVARVHPVHLMNAD